MRTLRLAKSGIVLSVLLSLPVVVPVEAQRRPPMGRREQGPDRVQLERRVRARMAEMIREQLGLSEEEEASLNETVRGFGEQRRQVGRQEQALRRRVEALMLEGGQDQAEAAELLERMSALRIQEAALFQEEHEALLEVLTPVQVLRLVNLREQLGQRIRRIRGQLGRGGGGRGGGDVRPGGGPGPFAGGHAFRRPNGSELPLLGGFSPER